MVRAVGLVVTQRRDWEPFMLVLFVRHLAFSPMHVARFRPGARGCPLQAQADAQRVTLCADVNGRLRDVTAP